MRRESKLRLVDEDDEDDEDDDDVNIELDEPVSCIVIIFSFPNVLICCVIFKR